MSQRGLRRDRPRLNPPGPARRPQRRCLPSGSSLPRSPVRNHRRAASAPPAGAASRLPSAPPTIHEGLVAPLLPPLPPPPGNSALTAGAQRGANALKRAAASGAARRYPAARPAPATHTSPSSPQGAASGVPACSPLPGLVMRIWVLAMGRPAGTQGLAGGVAAAAAHARTSWHAQSAATSVEPCGGFEGPVRNRRWAAGCERQRAGIPNRCYCCSARAATPGWEAGGQQLAPPGPQQILCGRQARAHRRG
jgi:hypothetical protein